MEKEQKRELIKIITCIALLVLLIIAEHAGILDGISEHLTMGSYVRDATERSAIPDSGHVANGGFDIVLFLPYFLLYIYAGRGVIKEAAEGVLHLELLDEEFLMTIATVGAFVTGEYAEGVAVMLLYELGEWFQDYAVDRSRDSIKDLMDIAPEHADRITEAGEVESIAPERVNIGDLLIIRPGEKIPVDGSVTEGEGMIDTSSLTGESVPRKVCPGDEIVSGCINRDTTLKIEARKKYEDSTVARILELVETASEKKSKSERFITKFARIYTPVVVLSAIALALIPPLLGYGTFMTWVYRACMFLVVSCPCAIVISVPLSFFGGIGAASRIGVLVKGSNYLEQLARIDTLVTDKTGTLTKGEFSVSKVVSFDGYSKDDVLRLASYCECFSDHPIALSIKAAYAGDIDKSKVERSENISGKGVRAMISGSEIAIGSDKLMEELEIDVPDEEIVDLEKSKADTIAFVAENSKPAGYIMISDEIKPGAINAISELRSSGIKDVVMLTGDRKGSCDVVASKLGIDMAYAELMPEDKVNVIESLIGESENNSAYLDVAGNRSDDVGYAIENKSGRRLLAFVGDGINDAPVLMRSDIGIAMGSLGSDAAIEAADVVIMDDDIGKIPKVIRIAKRTLAIAKVNIAFALAVKFLILLLSAVGIANMWLAVFADVGVAFLCILNSMRMLRDADSLDLN